MNEGLQLIWTDILAALEGIRMFELAKPAFLGLWFVILMMPLGGVDRRDSLACLVYVMFIAAAAATLMFALPSVLVNDDSSFNDQFITIMVLSAIATIRWNWTSEDLTSFFESVAKVEDGDGEKDSDSNS